MIENSVLILTVNKRLARHIQEVYGCLMKNMDTNRDIMLGLYFPCIPAWRQWEFIRITKGKRLK
ncbi:MAG: hypothetical protein U9P49_02870 [Thermodesulfobacteriota bacterium]|nr:hypothetical protein [Thermodesulfobacteriota bacterium]